MTCPTCNSPQAHGDDITAWCDRGHRWDARRCDCGRLILRRTKSGSLMRHRVGPSGIDGPYCTAPTKETT